MNFELYIFVVRCCQQKTLRSVEVFLGKSDVYIMRFFIAVLVGNIDLE